MTLAPDWANALNRLDPITDPTDTTPWPIWVPAIHALSKQVSR